MPYRDLIVIGASAGGIEALKTLLADLPATLPAAILVVVHVAPDSPRLLASILAQAGPLPVRYAEEGARIERGHIYVAPPDRHLLVEQGRLRVTRGPKENRFRPAIDPLFRAAAYSYGPQVIAIILSGLLDDGTVGLWAVKNRGGLAVVQDPSEARYPSMPQSALAHVAVDYQVPVTAMGALLAQLVVEPLVSEEEAAMAEDLAIEMRIALEDKAFTSGLLDVGTPSLYTCPECHGVLLQMSSGPLVRFRCHTGHAFTLASLVAEVSEAMEQTLWNTVRALEEQVLLLQQLAQGEAAAQPAQLVESLAAKRHLAEQQLELVRDLALQHALPSQPPARPSDFPV